NSAVSAWQLAPRVLHQPSPSPTWVCADNGQATSVWTNFNSQVASTLCFPVADPSMTVMSNSGGNPYPVAYDIIGFAPLKVLAYHHNPPGGLKGIDDVLTVEYDRPRTCGTQVGTGLPPTGSLAINLIR